VKDNQFMKWFVKQFGRPISFAKYERLLQREAALQEELNDVRSQIAEDKRLGQLLKAAMYTKNAATSKKPFSF
jgi:hypothetical protein